MMSNTLSVFVLMLLVLISVVPFDVTGAYPEETTLIMGTTDNVESTLDPAQAYDYFGWEIIQSLGSGLVEFALGATGSADIWPALATSWSVSSDGLEWTFHLRQGVLYEDNSTEFNATHVKYTFDRGISLDAPEGPFVGIGYGNIIENITIVSKHVVKFYLKIPFAPFLSLLACPASYIVDPEYAPLDTIISYTAGNARASHPMGLGPYKLKSWLRIAGYDAEMHLEANPNYWNKGEDLPRTKNIIIKFYADSTGLALAITRQDIDIAFRQLTATDITTMRNDPNLKVWEGTGAFIQYLVLQERYAPFNVTEVRQAVGAAINRTTIAQTVFQGQAEKLYSTIPNGMSGHTNAFLSLGDPNYTRTRELLSEVGYNETNKLTFKLWYESSGHYPQSAQLAQVLKASIEASGVITVTLESADWTAYRMNRINEVMDAYILGWYPDYVDPDNYVFPFLHSAGSSWIHHNYYSLQMDILVAWARANTSITVRNDLYGQIQTLMTNDCPIVPIFQGMTFAVTKPDVEGVYLDISQSFRIWYLHIPPELSKAPEVFEVVWESEVFLTVIESPSTVSNFTFNQSSKLISFSVSGQSDLTCFCNVTIPKQLLDGEPWMVKVDGMLVPFVEKRNETHTSLYFTYTHSIKELEIVGTYVIPEFPSAIILSVFTFFTLIVVALAKKIQCEVVAETP